ncbi:MAG: type IV pilus biogenesis/stability protein PilW [Pseudomonadota bacterium]
MASAPGKLAAALLGAVLLAGCAGLERQVGEDQAEAAEVNADLGIGYLREGEFEQAERNLRRALDFDPDHALAHLGMGAVYERRGSDARAEEHYRKALASDPDNPHAQTSLGALLCAREDYDEAQALFRQAIENPDYDQREIALMNSGVCFADFGDAERAEEQLRAALELQPRYPRALLEMAKLGYAEGRPMQTRAFLSRLDAQGIENAEMLLLCYQAETALGNRGAALECAQGLRRNYPDSREFARLERLEGDDG